ncbi:hypothetical protein IFM89_006395 [Coptis chinensis]|uniref:Uncharacterized protein n=1 Tax=Coptis chinensis TaxID=261450 RepID=A0A835HT86_9MAGN|nr:hypothetical protein IFM89_006395 [Coptis chinensis]
MGFSSSWDGTLSPNDFNISARALCEKLKVIYPVFPPWAWVPCLRPFGAASRQVEGYLSLEGFCCPKSIEGEIDNGSSSKEDATYPREEEAVDDATLMVQERLAGRGVRRSWFLRVGEQLEPKNGFAIICRRVLRERDDRRNRFFRFAIWGGVLGFVVWASPRRLPDLILVAPNTAPMKYWTYVADVGSKVLLTLLNLWNRSILTT